MALLGRPLTQAGLRGNLLEIGVYQGRSAVLLGYLLAASEKLVACDIFETEPPEGAILPTAWARWGTRVCRAYWTIRRSLRRPAPRAAAR